MSTLIIQPSVPLRQPSPIRIDLPAGVAPGAMLVDQKTGERIPAQPDGDGASIAILGPLDGERRLKLEDGKVSAPLVTMEQAGPRQVDVKIGGELFTSYTHDPEIARPFFHPVIGPTGDSVTRHFPMKPDLPGEARDHKHHRSMWSAYGELNGSDNWSEEPNHARQVADGVPLLVSGPVFGRLTAKNQWLSGDGKPQMAERRSLTVYQVGAERRLFDYEIAFTANGGDVLFGDTKEGGILSFRVATSMDAKDKGRIENSNGGVGEKECWGKAAAWCDYSGPVNGKTVGIAVMDHPTNFRSPVHWHVRDYGLMTTNCFGDSTFAGDESRKDGEYTLAAGRSLSFRYRVLLHHGNATEGNVDDAFLAYVNPPSVRVEP